MQWSKTICSHLNFLLTNVSISTAPHKQVIKRTPQNSIWYHGVANVSGDMSASDTRETQLSSWETRDWGRGRGDDFTKLKDCILLFNLRLYTWLHCGNVTRQRSSVNWVWRAELCVGLSFALANHSRNLAWPFAPVLTQPGRNPGNRCE